MKPIKMQMSAFGPYADWVEIDFDKFGENGLFLVTGDTGAGKTTIFDGICFALFGEMSGENRDGTMMRSDFAKPETKTFVRLEFQYKEKRYIVERNPAYDRPKLRSEGLTKEVANASLICPDERIVTGTGAVNVEIERILGINKNQFSQIAMIAQGDFLKLLLADNKDRSAIFRKVFSTDGYEKFQIELKQLSSQLKGQYEELTRGMLQFCSGIDCDVEDPNYELLEALKSNKTIYAFQEVFELLQTLITEDQKRYVLEEAQLNRLNQEIEGLALAMNKANEDNLKLKALENTEIQLNLLLGQVAMIDDQIIKVTEAEKALYKVKPLEERMTDAQAKAIETEKRISQIHENLERLTKENETYETLYKRAKEQEPQREQFVKEMTLVENELPQYEALEAVNDKIISLETEMQMGLQSTEESQLRLKKLNDQMLEIQKENEVLSQSDAALSDIERRLDQEIRYRENLERLDRIQEKIKTSKVNQEKAVQDFERKNKEYMLKQDAYKQAEQLYFSEQAGILAAHLKQDEPCPVCGATVHPNLAQKSPEAPSKQSLDQLKAQLDETAQVTHESNQILSNILNALEILAKDFETEATALFGEQFSATQNKRMSDPMNNRLSDTVNGSISGFDFDSIYRLIQSEKEKNKEALKVLEQQVLVKKEQLLKLETNQNQLVAINQEIVGLEAILKESEMQIQEMRLTLAGHQSHEATIKRSLKYPSKVVAIEARDAHAIAAKDLLDQYNKAESELSQSIQALGKAQASREELEKSLKSEQLVFEETRTALDLGLRENGFVDFDAYRLKLLPESEIKKIQDAIMRFKSQLSESESEKARLIKETQSLTYQDTVCLEEQKRTAEGTKRELDQRKMLIHSRVKNNEKIQDHLKSLSSEIEKVEQKYKLYKNLSDTANGDLSGKQRLAFERYIQAFYFNRVLLEANKRFSYMTNNRFELVRKESSSDLRTQAGLEIDVRDQYTGKVRSVKSLSGGESFKASLALALGLSDLIQTHAGGVQIDTMFVDEGFGSLDSESLEQAIEVLNALTHGNRLVGIISHVSELRERIDKKIIVKKGTSGSTVELV